MRRTQLLLALPAALVGLLAIGSPAVADDDATITVIHGIPGGDLGLDPTLPVDISVSGLGCALADFQYGDKSDRIAAPAGSYDIKIFLADPAVEPCEGTEVLDVPQVPFEAGENATVIAHLTEAGGITATKYTNDLSPSEFHDGRAAIHHVAAVGGVDIRVYGLFPFRGFRPQVSLDDVRNPASAAADLGAGFYLVSIAPAGGKPVAFEWIQIKEDTSLLVYATGSLTAGTFQLLADRQDLGTPASDGTAAVTIIHGIPGTDLGADPELPVDVWVSELGCALPDFRFGAITDQIPVPAGEYDIRITLATEDSAPCEGPLAVEALGVPFDADENATVIAHLSDTGAPTASKFTNDLSDPGSSQGRLAVHHTANAGAVDVAVTRRIFIFKWVVAFLEDVVNGDAANLPAAKGRYIVSIAPAGGASIFDEWARVRAGEATLAYAVGSVEAGTFQLIVDRQPLN